MFEQFGHAPELRQLEAEFFSVLALGSFPLLLQNTLSCFYSGRGKTRVIMVINIACAALNAVLDYLLIFGKLGFPRLGIVGAGTATVISWTVGALLYLAALRFGQRHAEFALGSSWRFDRVLFLRLLRYGFPNGVQLLVDVASWTLFVQMIGKLGTQPLAATSLAFNLNTLVFIPLLGLGTAVMTLTGQRIGARRPDLAVRSTGLAFTLAAVYIAGFAAIYVLTPQLILLPYGLQQEGGASAQLQQDVVQLLRFVAVYSLFDAMTVVFSSATRGAGDTRFALIFTLISGTLLLVLPTYLSTHLGQRGLIIPWIAVTGFNVVLGIGFLLRFLQGRWKSMRVIELAEQSTGPDASP